MSKSDIRSWISSSSADPNDESSSGWQRDRVLEDWPRSLEYVQSTLLTAKNKLRIEFLKEELYPIATNGELSLSQIMDVFRVLTLTYPKYNDSGSRDAVELVGMEFIRRDEAPGQDDTDATKFGVAEQIIGWLSNEVGRLAKRGTADTFAASDLFVLLGWACGIYTVCGKHDPQFDSSSSWKNLVGILAVLLDMIQESMNAKPALKHGAVVRVRRALRSTGDKIPQLISTLVTLAKTYPTPSRLLPLIGTSVDVLIRLKHRPEPAEQRLPPELKDAIFSLYTAQIFMTKSVLPTPILKALNDFISTYVNPEDLNKTVLPAIEKSFLRSPEYSLPAVVEFFVAYKHPLEVETFQRLLSQILTVSKSSNALVRLNAVELFKGLIALGPPEDPHRFSKLAVPELLALPKAGKTASPDHRITLYTMLGALTPTEGVSAPLLQTATSLLAKETHEATTAVLASALSPHIRFLLSNDQLPAEIAPLISKEMGSSKPAVRRAFSSLAGNVFYTGPEDDVGSSGVLDSPGGIAFAKAVLPGLEGLLKTIAGNPLNSNPFEGYIAAAVLLGPVARSNELEGVARQNAVLAAVPSPGPKHSFLTWEKIYQKVVDEEDERWLLRVAVPALQFFTTELRRSELLRTQLGSIFVHLALNGHTPEVRKKANAAIAEASARDPQLTPSIVREATRAFLVRGPPAPAKAATADDVSEPVWNKHARLSSLLLNSVSLERAEQSVKEDAVNQLVVIAHHGLVCGSDRQTWIDVCQKAGLDPRELIDKHIETIFQLILEASDADTFATASYNALTTLVFVSPSVTLPRTMGQLRVDLDPKALNELTDFDFGVWATPAGTTFVDVLSSNKGDDRPAKGKDYKIAKWEAEIREAIAAKKSTPVTLTKQQKALVQAQLDKEVEIRSRVDQIKRRVVRGLNAIKHVVSAGSEEFQSYMSPIVSLLLNGTLDRGSFLVGSLAFETYLDLANAASTRLDTFRRWIGIATLRALKVGSIPEDLQVEPLHTLVLRVLYRLRFLSEQGPFDAATFSYAFPLLERVLSVGGIVEVDSSEEGEEVDPLEQVALILDTINFHSREFANAGYPRLQTIDVLIRANRQQPKLAKESSSALIGLGESICVNAEPSEVEAIIRGTLFQEPHVRLACLQTLQPFDLTEMDWSPQLWLAYHDEDERNADLAQHLWEDNGFDVPEAFLQDLVQYLEHANAYARVSTAAAISDAVEQWPQAIHATVSTLQDYYRDKAKILAPEFDEYGMVIAASLDRQDPWPAREAIARSFELLAPSFTEDEVEPFFRFLIQDQALGDREADVRRGMLAAGTAIIDLHGKSKLAGLISIFEHHLSQPSAGTETDDQIREAVVILFGRVARHLDAADSRIPEIVDRLVEALKTPSEQVQIAVSDCLSPLVRLMRPTLSGLVDRLFDDLVNGPKYATRRGAAYGLAGIIRGTGIGGMKEFDVLQRLKTAAGDKKRFEPKQGVMFAFETLASTLGRLFEPYVMHILPLLLSLFGDSVADVRDATQDAARVIMANLSGYGVKTILPTLLEGLDEKQWRSKKGSIELLGMMAYCSPRQLSLSLPVVIPRLTGVLTDSHTQVRTAANKSLKQFGEVISNPEIQNLVPVLLKALVDPAKTPNALTSLLKTSFMHYIDHSSLALVVPILERGLRERGAEVKKKAVQIIGNLASLTDSKDFVPYLDELLPLVHTVLVDPVPEARATAAKALGTLVERLGEVHFPDLVPGLLRTLKTDTSGVDRQGAAQGLSEVLAGLGMERMESLLPDVIANARSPRPTVREGFMSLLVYLPATFGSRFQPHLPKIISPILGGLADTEEYVREAAMRAGRMVVTNYSTRAIDLLLPELENGMFDPSWRIRQSSITLVGELLFKVSGVSGKVSEVDEEDVVAASTAETSRKALGEVLGIERRDRILSALYLIRQDSVVVVRQSSIQIWKVLVHNTPRTVREILPSLINQIVNLLSSDEFEQQETAGRTVGELCRKFGERILGEILPLLKAKSTSPDPRTREGVASFVSQVMQNATETQREDHEDDIVTIVRVALVDDEPNVRTAAAQAFDVLQDALGARAIDQTIPTLLEALRQPGSSSETALQALKEVMAVRAATVFPVLIPTLTAIPMSVFNAHALASLVSVAGSALSRRLTAILTPLVKVWEDDIDDELREAVDEAFSALFSSVSDAEGLNTVMMLLISWAKHDSPKRRVSACRLFALFCKESELDDSMYRVDWVRQLVGLFDDPDVDVHTAAWAAFDSFVKSIPKDELEPLVVPLRRTIESSGAPGRTVPGFDLPKGVSAFVPIIIAGLTTGSNEQREQAAYSISDLVERTAPDAIKPFIVSFTGPLIRVATQATTYPPGVKTGILTALMTMLERIPAFVKPFFPQLQRVFVKSISDASSTVVRTRASLALGVLMKNQPRVDPVITELIAGVKGNDDSIASSFIFALARVMRNASPNVGDKAREAVIEVVDEGLKESHGEHYGQAVGKLLAALGDKPELIRSVVEAHLVAGTPPSVVSSNAILSVVDTDEDEEEETINVFQKLDILRRVAQKAIESAANEKPFIARPAREARDILKKLDDETLAGLF